MKDKLITLTTYTLMISCLVAGTWFGQTELLRLSVWATWVIMIVSMIGVLLPSKEFYKDPKTRKKVTWQRTLYFSHLALLIATGWIFTATMYFIVWVCLWTKKQMWDGEQKDDTVEAA